jgi:hypothetical protein
MLSWGVNVTSLSSFSAALPRMALYPKGQSITRNITMMVFCLGYVPAMIGSSIDPNEKSCSHEKHTSECQAGRIFL